jgi:hypothetical protein
MDGYRTENITMPCANCMLTWMRAGLEYADGRQANINTGLWLHHTAIGNTGRADPICTNRTADGAYFFASGNERTIANLCDSGTVKTGYFIRQGDTFIMVTELMNTGSEPQPAYVTVTYEFIPGPPGIPMPGATHDDIPSVPAPYVDMPHADTANSLFVQRSQFKDSQPLYMDVSNCSDSSEVPAYPDRDFSFAMKPWSSDLDPTGSNFKAVYVGGHIHDGGTHIDIYKNNLLMCRCAATYGQNSMYEESASAMDGMAVADNHQHRNNITAEVQSTAHISKISVCDGLGDFKDGDVWQVKAYYDTRKYAPMPDPRGGLMPMMGISILYAYKE